MGKLASLLSQSGKFESFCSFKASWCNLISQSCILALRSSIFLLALRLFRRWSSNEEKAVGVIIPWLINWDGVSFCRSLVCSKMRPSTGDFFLKSSLVCWINKFTSCRISLLDSRALLRGAATRWPTTLCWWWGWYVLWCNEKER